MYRKLWNTGALKEHLNEFISKQVAVYVVILADIQSETKSMIS